MMGSAKKVWIPRGKWTMVWVFEKTNNNTPQPHTTMFTNPYTGRPETKEERIARYAEQERMYRGALSTNQRRGYLANCTRKANKLAKIIAELKALPA